MINKTEIPCAGLAAKLAAWDQTIGCEECGQGWWAENYTPDPTMFHSLKCPLFGRRDVVGAEGFDLEYIEKKIGRRIGIDMELSYAPCPVCKNQKWGKNGMEARDAGPERFTSALMHGLPCCRDCFAGVAKWMKKEPFQGYKTRTSASDE